MSNLPFGGKFPVGGVPGGAGSGMQQVLARLAQLEAEVARLTGAIKVTPDGSVEIASNNKITLKAASTLQMTAASCTVSAAQYQVTAGMMQTTGMFKCDVMQANTVIAATYTPGAGNIW